jgi:diacylglycerol kinase family enzyme
MRRHLLVGNPSAQSGRAREAIVRARELLEAREIQVIVVATEPQGRTPGIVEDAIERHAPDVVLCLGGDGTFNEVARGILASGATIPMGMIPMGTANDQGRSFGLEPGPANIARHVAVILEGHVTKLDVGAIDALSSSEGEPAPASALFFDSASFGLAPDILAARNRDRDEIAKIPLLRQLYRDQAVYVGAAVDRLLASFVEPMKFHATVTTESWDRTWLGLTDLVIKATPIFAGAWVFDRACEPDDGLFEAIAITSRAEWVARIAADHVKSPLPPPREHLAASRFELQFDRPGDESVASQIDGEEWIRGDRFRIEVMPNALPLLTPRGFVPPWRRP